ncbi:MAG: hypothetical protein L0287_01720 [Anaerolineae bacterium]|nr:hypothetical protein [Anaerolineae bacterium]
MAAFPYLFEESFEGGDQGNFDAISPDPFTRAGFDHYTDLARRSDVKVAPYRGAFCFRVDLATNTTDHYVQETGSLDVALAGTVFTRLYFYVSANTVMADGDEFAIQQLWSSVSTVEAGVYINYTTANGFRVGIGETSASSFQPLTLGRWHCIELKAVIDNGAGNNGTLDAWLDNSAFTQVTGLDQGAITSMVFGVIGQDAGTTVGAVLIDEIIGSTQRLHPIDRRYPETLILTNDCHAFVGAGCILDATLISGAATDNKMIIYDTDKGNDGITGGDFDDRAFVAYIANTSNNEVLDFPNVPIDVLHGAFVVLEGTNPRAIIHIGRAQGYYSDGRIRDHASRRRHDPFNN